MEKIISIDAESLEITSPPIGRDTGGSHLQWLLLCSLEITSPPIGRDTIISIDAETNGLSRNYLPTDRQGYTKDSKSPVL